MPSAGSFVKIPGRVESWRDLAASTIPFSPLVRCPATGGVATVALSVRLLPPLFGFPIHRISSTTRGALRPSEGRLGLLYPFRLCSVAVSDAPSGS